MNVEAPKTITVDNVEHDISGFSDKVKQLVAIRTVWSGDLAKERLAVTKTETAIRGLDTELLQSVGKELAERTATSTTDLAE